MKQRDKIQYYYSTQNTIIKTHMQALHEKLKTSFITITWEKNHSSHCYGDKQAQAFFKDILQTIQNTVHDESMLQAFLKTTHVLSNSLSKQARNQLMTSLQSLDNSGMLFLLSLIRMTQEQALPVKRIILVSPENSINLMQYAKLFTYLLELLAEQGDSNIIVYSSNPFSISHAFLTQVTILKPKLKTGVHEVKLTKKQVRKAYLNYRLTLDLALALQSSLVFLVETQAQAFFLENLLKKIAEQNKNPVLFFQSFHILNLETYPLEILLPLFTHDEKNQEFYAILNKDRLPAIFNAYQGTKNRKPPFKGSFEKKIEWLRAQHIYLFKTNFEIDLIYNNEKTVLQVLKKHFYMDYEKIRNIPKSKPDYKETLLRVLRQKRNEFAFLYLEYATQNELPLTYQLMLKDLKL